MTALRIVRALTVQNPWAHLIADVTSDDPKRIENRVWYAARYVDELLIHAGKAWDKHAAGFLGALGVDMPDLDAVTTSAIVAVGRLDGVCSASHRDPDRDCGCGRWAAVGQHHWRLADIRPLTEPVRCRGTLGLWVPRPELLDAVHAQLPAPAGRPAGGR